MRNVKRILRGEIFSIWYRCTSYIHMVRQKIIKCVKGDEKK